MNFHAPQHMLQFGVQRRRPDAWVRMALFSNRIALLGAFACGILIPVLIQSSLHGTVGWFHSWLNSQVSFLGSFVTLILAHVCLRRIGVLPMVNDKVLVLFTFTAIYALAGFLSLLLMSSGTVAQVAPDYFVMSFVGGTAWYFLLAVMRARHNCPRLALANFPPLDPELMSTHVDWIYLHEPRLPTDATGIVFDSQIDQSPEWERLFARAVLRNIPVYDIGELRERMTGRVRLRSRPELVFGQLLPSQPYLRIKRLIDFLSVLPALLLALPVIAAVALAIRLESPGSPFYVQRRVGYQGRIFRCYKLRSMRSDIPGPAYTTERDPRVTRIGKFIRKWRIDELPQLLNILKGEMSWIGPRPEAVSLSRDYQRQIPYYSYRHAVPPGLSGWAAVHQGNVALRDAVSRKLEYDFFYIKYFSIWLDILIVLMTIRTVVTGFGSR